MNYSNLTKEQIINGIRNNSIGLYGLSQELKDDKDIVLEALRRNGLSLKYSSNRLKDDNEVVLEAIKNDGSVLEYASERLQDNKELLEILEKENTSYWNLDYQKWYVERMEVLANIRRQEEKEFMAISITPNNIKAKKVKF